MWFLSLLEIIYSEDGCIPPTNVGLVVRSGHMYADDVICAVHDMLARHTQ